MSLSVMFADYDPGTLTGFYTIFLAVGIGIILAILGGLAFCLKSPRIAGRLLVAAWMSVFIGISMAVVIVWLSHKGVIHLL
jgi:hypothetical protein